MAYDAVGVGPYDLAAGVDFLLSLAKAKRPPWLSANLVRAGDGRPVFPPFRIIARKGLRIAVIGLTGKTGVGKGYRLRPWKAALGEAVAAAGKKAPDMVILLNSMTGLDYLDISRRFPAVRVVIDTAPRGGNGQPVIYGNLIRCNVTARGKCLARLDIGGDIGAPWRPDLSARKQNLLRRLDSLNWRLNRLMRSRGKVNRAYIEGLKRQKEQAGKELARINEQMKADRAAAGFKYKAIAIEPDIGDDPGVLKAVARGKREILAIKKRLEKDRKRRAEEMKNIFRAGYTGWNACGRCHERQERSWRTSRHAYAYNTLQRKQAGADLRCLPCHVTGVITGRETYALFLPGKLRAVGCESCHGPGRKHAADPAAAPMNAAAARKACGRCHVPEHDDDFVLERDVARLNCSGPE
jgi:hypothetical protein